MKSVSYFSEFFPDNNVHRTDRYLAVNCTGHAVYPYAPSARTVRNDFYLIYLTDGEIHFEKPYHKKPMKTGEFIILHAHSPFEYAALSSSVDYYWVHFSGREAESVLAGFKLATNRVMHVGIHDRLVEDFFSLFLTFSDKSALAEELRAHALLTFLLDLSKALHSKAVSDSRAAVTVARSTAYIHEHIAEPLTVESLAAREYLSSGRYRDIFRRMLGMSPQEYILKLRVDIARDLLTGSHLSIAEIALSVGCPDSRYFSRLFLKRTGFSPSAYRKIGTTASTASEE